MGITTLGFMLTLSPEPLASLVPVFKFAGYTDQKQYRPYLPLQVLTEYKIERCFRYTAGMFCLIEVSTYEQGQLNQ